MKNYPQKTFLDWKVEPQTASEPNQSLLAAAKLFRINTVGFTSAVVVRRSARRRPRRRSGKPAPPDAGLLTGCNDGTKRIRNPQQ